MKIKLILFLLLSAISFTGCTYMSNQAASRGEESLQLEAKAKSGAILTENEWTFLMWEGGNRGRNVAWLDGLIGKPDESISGGNMGTFLIYHNKSLDPYTDKPSDLCVCAFFGGLDGKLYDAQRIRNMQ